MTGYRLVVTIGAAARLTRLVTRDTITEPLRDKILLNPAQRRAQAAGAAIPAPTNPRSARARAWLHTLVTCDWCTGMWVAALVGTASHVAGHRTVFTVPATILTTAHAVGWLAEHE